MAVNFKKLSETGAIDELDKERLALKDKDEIIIAKITFKPHKKYERVVHIDGFAMDATTPFKRYTTSKVICEVLDKLIAEVGTNKEGELKDYVAVRIVQKVSDDKNKYLALEDI